MSLSVCLNSSYCSFQKTVPDITGFHIFIWTVFFPAVVKCCDVRVDAHRAADEPWNRKRRSEAITENLNYKPMYDLGKKHLTVS